MLLNFASEHDIRRVQVNWDDLKLNGKHQFRFMLMMLIYWEEACVLQRKTQNL